jgi:4-amino-4-deoxy-L-arabinose transferase-like glycosyltransferase
VRAPRRLLGEQKRIGYLGLGLVVAVSAVMNTVRLSQNGYANIFYSAGVRSMIRSWHNFFFVSFDSGGLVTVDKPPLALWAQALSAKVFGFSPLSLLLPEALMGVAAVALLYLIVSRRFGAAAGFASALTLALFPSFVAVSRENGVDPLLILLLVMACGAGILACESGRWRTLIWCGVLIGLAFNTKTLAAYLAVPAIAFAYLVCAPSAIGRRLVQLLAAGAVMAVVSFSWMAVVEATPVSKRPFVGSSTNNTELGLTFEYNGFGRVEGQAGGPGQTRGAAGALVPLSQQRRLDRLRAVEGHRFRAPPSAHLTPARASGRNRNPIPFGGAPGPLRLFGVGLGDQAAWMLPFALLGLLALALLILRDWRAPEPPTELERPHGRRDPRLACLLVLGGWLLTEAVVLSTSKGIVHPYYVSALGPGVGAMAGVGIVSLFKLCQGRWRLVGLVMAGAGLLATLATEVVLMHREHYMRWFVPLLLALVALGFVALALATLFKRAQIGALASAFVFALLLVVPAAYASTTWLAPVEGTFPAAGPKQTAGQGGVGVNGKDLAIVHALMRYLRSHGATPHFELLTVAAETAAPYMLLGMRAAAIGGYSGVDPALDGQGLAKLVRRGQARYVLIGGEYSSRGGNGASKAVLKGCRELVPAEWGSPIPYPLGLVLFDCAGREKALAAT